MNSFFLCLAALSMNLHNAEVICEYSPDIIEQSEKYNIKPSLIVAVGRVESRWTPLPERHIIKRYYFVFRSSWLRREHSYKRHRAL